MLTNIEAIENLRGLARLKQRDYETKTVGTSLLKESIADGWEVHKESKKAIGLRKQKTDSIQFADRIWSLLYRMNFTHLSNTQIVEFSGQPQNESVPSVQLNILGVDDEIALAIKCKHFDEPQKWPTLKQELAEINPIRQYFASSVNNQFPMPYKRKIVLAVFVSNVILSEDDKTAFKNAKIAFFEKSDLDYYENLVSHLGQAAKYQFFADMLPGEQVPGLEIKIPAVRTKMGGTNCYTFSISPEYLLKISYVSHRTKGKASDIHAYQRMLNKSRLKSIKQYISDDGIFPTNIVINLENKRVQFYPIRQEATGKDGGVLGWLTITPAYKSAWIIDGQHRLFAYSGHELAHRSLLSVLAFEGLLASEQAKLFIDINAKQKSVNSSLLEELYADLHWESDAPEIRKNAIVSRAIRILDTDPESAFYQRIQAADTTKDTNRCITFTSVFKAIERNKFHIAKEKDGRVLEFGPLWAATNEATLKRTVYILKNWFNLIRLGANDWWDRGAGEGGGLAMNNSIVACIDLLGSILQFWENNGTQWTHLDNKNLFEHIQEYAKATGEYLGALSLEERANFRGLQGRAGQNVRTRRCQQWLHQRFPAFNPPGLEKFLQEEKAETNKRAKEIIEKIEKNLQKLVINELKREFGEAESGWWLKGVPQAIRLSVRDRYEKDDGKRGSQEYYFDLIHYRTIAMDNWTIFENILGDLPKNKSKKDRTEWIQKINEMRNIVSHASSGISLSIEQLNQLQGYEKWFLKQIEANDGYD